MYVCKSATIVPTAHPVLLSTHFSPLKKHGCSICVWSQGGAKDIFAFINNGSRSSSM